MEPLILKLNKNNRDDFLRLEMDFSKYRNFITKFKINKIGENILNNYIINQKFENSYFNNISKEYLRSFILLVAKSLAIEEGSNIINKENIQYALIVLDYFFKSLNFDKLLKMNKNNENQILILKLDNLLYNTSLKSINSHTIVSNKFLDNNNYLFKNLENQILRDLGILNKKSIKKSENNLIQDILNSIKLILNILVQNKVPNEHDIIISSVILYRILFDIPKYYYYTLFDLYRLRFTKIFKELVNIKINDDFILALKNSNLNNIQKLVMKIYPNRDLQNIGVSNSPIYTLYSQFFILLKSKYIRDSKNHSPSFKTVDDLINKIILFFNFDNLEFDNNLESNIKFNEMYNEILEFYKYGFKKQFSLSAINLISYFKNFINYIFEEIFGRKEMLFYYSSIPQQITSLVVILAVLDCFKNHEKNISIKNVCNGIRAYSYFLFDFKI